MHSVPLNEVQILKLYKQIKLDEALSIACIHHDLFWALLGREAAQLKSVTLFRSFGRRGSVLCWRLYTGYVVQSLVPAHSMPHR